MAAMSRRMLFNAVSARMNASNLRFAVFLARPSCERVIETLLRMNAVITPATISSISVKPRLSRDLLLLLLFINFVPAVVAIDYFKRRSDLIWIAAAFCDQCLHLCLPGTHRS